AFGSVFVLATLAYPLYASLKGELLPGHGHVSLFEAVRFQLFTRPSTGSAFSPSSVSRQLIDGWLRTDPWLLGVGTVLSRPGGARQICAGRGSWRGRSRRPPLHSSSRRPGTGPTPMRLISSRTKASSRQSAGSTHTSTGVAGCSSTTRSTWIWSARASDSV